jgi:hypothetical protein
MTTPVVANLFNSVSAKNRRLRNIMYTLIALAAVLICTASMSWYRFEYTSNQFDGTPLEYRPVIDVDPGKMAEISRDLPSLAPLSVSNPQVSQVLDLPMFVIAPLLGVFITLLGLWLRSAALSLLGLLGHFWGWMHLSRSRWWFENAPGRENWTVSTSLAQSLFWFSLMAAALVTVIGALQAFHAYRAFRAAKLANGETVEESATEMFIRLITRAATNRVSSTSSK